MIELLYKYANLTAGERYSTARIVTIGLYQVSHGYDEFYGKLGSCLRNSNEETLTVL